MIPPVGIALLQSTPSRPAFFSWKKSETKMKIEKRNIFFRMAPKPQPPKTISRKPNNEIISASFLCTLCICICNDMWSVGHLDRVVTPRSQPLSLALHVQTPRGRGGCLGLSHVTKGLFVLEGRGGLGYHRVLADKVGYPEKDQGIQPLPPPPGSFVQPSSCCNLQLLGAATFSSPPP